MRLHGQKCEVKRTSEHLWLKMASIDMDVIKDLPGYKVILKAVLRSQIQQLVDQLAEHTDEEYVILTANVSDGTLTHLGSDFGKRFLETYDDVKKTFLGFCLSNQHSKPSAESSVNQTKVLPSSCSNFTKIHSKVLPKSRHSPYQGSRPRSKSPFGSKPGTSNTVPKNITDKRNKEGQLNASSTGASFSESENSKEVSIKQEPGDIADENSKGPLDTETNDRSDSDETGSRLAQVSGMKSNLEEFSEGANTSVDWANYTDSMTESSGHWADNSEFMSNATEGFLENLEGQNASFVCTKREKGADTAVYFQSSRGGTKMSLNGFVYNADKQGKLRTYWRCHSRKCKGRLIMNKSDGAVLQEIFHDHDPDFNIDKVRKVMFLEGGWSCYPCDR